MTSALQCKLSQTLSRTPEVYFKTPLDHLFLCCVLALVTVILVEVDTLVCRLITYMSTLKLQPRTDRCPVTRITSTWADKITNHLRFSNIQYCWEDLIILQISKALCNVSGLFSVGPIETSVNFKSRWSYETFSQILDLCLPYLKWSYLCFISSSRPFQARNCTLFLASQ